MLRIVSGRLLIMTAVARIMAGGVNLASHCGATVQRVGAERHNHRGPAL